MSNPDEPGFENNEIDDSDLSAGSDIEISQLAEAIVDSLDIPNENKSQKIEQVRKTLIISGQLIKSPVPPPDWMAGYGEIDPTAPDRILRLAETEQQHRHVMEEQLVKSQVESRQTESRLREKELDADRGLAYLGLIFAFIIVLVFLVFIAFLIWKDKTVEAFYSLLGGLAILLANFLRSRISSSEKNGKDKDKS